MVNLFKILSDHFEDDKKLGKYIRMLGEVPDADLQLPEGFTVSWTVGEHNVYRASSHGGDISNEGYTLDEMLKSAGIKGVSGGKTR
tara:strand:- start:397 stop:654 length:258 start_codon:yes stop_codon:yes gene_type:complete